ncbi:EpsG family protein [Butyricimonas virosa]|jgi:hypothetical protein|uniref:EpsG family protein n=1 Tax=Butyricimonas virosa TaxID=544645 RepID=A0ABX7HBD3_9BACT|nr:EpsG family protein [Butyricimonas virosa]QRO51715.1 EpsG family protein [Butyricimonas virosa]UWO47520.1 EpsG family protein [Butyricimonas virosa]
MIQTLFVYLFLTFFLLFFAKYTSSVKQKSIGYPMFIGLLIYSVVFGMRYGVGMDHLSYLDDYLDISKGGEHNQMEKGFFYISKLFAFFDFHYVLYFSFFAFVQLFVLYYVFRCRKRVYVWLTYTFMIGCVWLSFMNGIRQITAFVFFMFSIKFITQHKFWKYVGCIFIASLFHKSAVVLLIFYPIFKQKLFFSNLIFQFFLLISALIIMNINVIQDVFVKLEIIGRFIGYEGYTDMVVNHFDSLLFSMERNRGIGFYSILLIDMILILYSNETRKQFDHSYGIMYNLYFVGVLWHYVFNGSVIMGRPNYYMYGFQFVIAAHTLLYLFNQYKCNRIRSKLYSFLGLVFLYFLIFCATMYRMDENTSRFIFFWQKELYYLK